MTDKNKKLSEGLTLWGKVSTPLHKHTKSFTRGGGFKGTSISVTAMAMMATEIFGPNGIGWGVVVEHEQYIDGHKWLSDDGTVLGNDIIHVIRAHIWYKIDGEKYETSPQFGQTTFVGRNKNGPFTDEEAPKKSISDVQNKCLSLLGFASDIFLGKWDDNKYVAEVKQQQANDAKPPEEKKEFKPDISSFWQKEKYLVQALSKDAWVKLFTEALDKAPTNDNLTKLIEDNSDTLMTLEKDDPETHGEIMGAYNSKLEGSK